MTLIGTRKRHHTGRRAWVIITAISAILVVTGIVCRLLVGQLVRYEGSEMTPVVTEGAWLLVRFGQRPSVGDLVLVSATPRPVLRTVVAQMGDPIPTRRKARKASESEKKLGPNELYVHCPERQRCQKKTATGRIQSERLIGTVIGQWSDATQRSEAERKR